MKYYIPVLFAFLIHIANAATINLHDIRLGKHANETRVVFEFNEPYTYKAFTLKKPNRFVIDIPDTNITAATNKLDLKKYLIDALRISKRGTHVRLVFDLSTAMSAKIFRLDKKAKNDYRLVVDLKPSQLKKVIKPSVIVKQAGQIDSARDVIVVIDPGHGGKDPGAAGARGTKEKYVVLSISKALERAINNEPGLKAYLTRQGDYYIGLRERLDIARAHKADIFIAVHADAFMKRSSKGASVFALSQRGASSEAARWLAERENHSELGDASLMDKGYILRSVLIDLSQTATITASLHLGSQVLDQLGHITQLHNQQVEQAGFVVLKSPDIPSILIETGFISNPREEIYLRSQHNQRKLAHAITQGIKRYFWRYPPRGSALALQARARKHVVKAGDSLSQIAVEYAVSVKSLKHFNKLKSDVLRRGQVLRVPQQEV